MRHNNKFVILLVAVIALIAVLVTTSTPDQNTISVSNITPTKRPATQTVAPSPAAPVDIRIAWFYKPISDEELFQLASHYTFFILTRNDETERDELLALGIPKPVLQYFRFDVIEDPGSCEDQPFRNQVAYQPGDFCRISEEHPDWFLLNRYGRRISENESNKVYYRMDPGNEGWREFYLQRVMENMADANWGGVFLDNVEVSLARLESRGQFPIRYSDDQSYRAAIQGFLHYMRDGYFKVNNRLIFANLIGARNESEHLQYIDVLDGTMHEGWSVSKANGYYSRKKWETQLTIAEQMQEAGKSIILVSQGDKDDVQKEKFTFASYLLINQGKAIFRYANSDHYNEIWWYDNYVLNLGQPLGPRYKSGNRWYRDYENGRVMVDPGKHEAEFLLTK